MQFQFQLKSKQVESRFIILLLVTILYLDMMWMDVIFESYQAFKLASERARKGKGPSVIISDVVRLLPHSSSDDHAKYRSTKELDDDKKEILFYYLKMNAF